MIKYKHQNSDIDYRRYELILTYLLIIIVVVVALYQKLSPNNEIQTERSEHKDQHHKIRSNAVIVERDRKLVHEQTNRDNKIIKKQIKKINQKQNQLIKLINEKKYAQARHLLLKFAAKALDDGEQKKLGQILQVLGRIAIVQGDLHSSEVYLFEALDILQALSNPTDIADIQLLIGKMYANRRKQAQSAGVAYEDLLMSRYYLSKSRLYLAKQTLDKSIKINLNLGRHGSVASAYKTMAKYYRRINDFNGEQQALINAAKNYAYCGQKSKAIEIVEILDQRGSSLAQIQSLKYTIDVEQAKYKHQINLVSQSKDYMRLYNLYKSKGEISRAWQFRIKASQVISQSNKRDMYHRSADVMALLYDANFNYDKAKKYYAYAQQNYLKHNKYDSYYDVEILTMNLL